MWTIKEKEIGQIFKYRKRILKVYKSIYDTKYCNDCYFAYRRRRKLGSTTECCKVFKCSKDERKDKCNVFYIRVN